MDVAVFLVFAMGMCVSVCFLVSRISGWSKLARAYGTPLNLGESLREFRMASVNLGLRYVPIRYSWSMNVAVYDKGLTFQPILLFSLFSPKLYIPWSALVVVEEKTPIYETFNFRANGVWPVFAVFGKCGRYCADRWRTLPILSPQAPS